MWCSTGLFPFQETGARAGQTLMRSSLFVPLIFVVVCGTETSPRQASIRAHQDALSLEGAELEGTAPVDIGPGPLAAMQSMGSDGLSPLAFRLAEPIGDEASVSFWLRPSHAYANGVGRPEIEHAVLDIPSLAALTIRQNKSVCSLSWEWDSRVTGAFPMITNLPELPAGESFHLVYTWNSKVGRFDAYLNGTPLRLPASPVAAWILEPSDSLRLFLGNFKFADLEIENRYSFPEDSAARTPAEYRGRHGSLMGIRDRRPPSSDGHPAESDKGLTGKLIYENSLGRAEDVADWVLEGPGQIEFKEGWIEMSSLRPGGPDGHLVYWCPLDFPDRFIAEWEIQPVSDHGLCIVFFAAKGIRGEDIFDPGLPRRNGVFQHYIRGEILSYHISYYANTPGSPGRMTFNLRKNNQFYLVANGPPAIPPGSKKRHRIRLLSDLRKAIDFRDDGQRYGPVYQGGKIGLRQMQWMRARYRNFKVWNLEQDHRMRPSADSLKDAGS